jgi:hypothetical protein
MDKARQGAEDLQREFIVGGSSIYMEKPPIGRWGVAAALVALPGGHRNTAFRTRGLARDLVFKTTRRGEDAISWLVPVFALAERSGFIVPWPMKSARGRYVEDGWTCEPFIHGERWRAEDMAGLGGRIAQFQAASGDVAQRPGFASACALLQCDVGGDVDLQGMPDEIVARCRATWSRIAGWPTGVVHGDLQPGNLLRVAGGQVALLDWDECRVDARLFDDVAVGLAADEAAGMALLAWEVACSWRLEPEYARRLATRLMGRAGF